MSNVTAIEIAMKNLNGHGYVALATGYFPLISTSIDAPPFNRTECHFERVTLVFQDGAFCTFFVPEDK